MSCGGHNAQRSHALSTLPKELREASILARKEIFGMRARRLPMMRWLLNMLRAGEDHQLKWEVIRAALSLEFPDEEAERQIDTLIEWGRYGELVAYDDDGEIIHIEGAKGLQSIPFPT